MNTPRLAKRYRQATALVLLATALGAIAFFAVVPLVRHHNQLQAEIQDQRILLARLNGFAENKTAAEQLAERNELRLQSGVFLAGSTDAMRAANLQALLTDIAKQKGIRLRSTRAQPAADHQGVRFIGAQAEMSANIKKVQELLLALEAVKPHLFVQTLHITQNVTRRGSQADLLDVRVNVEGPVATDMEATP